MISECLRVPPLDKPRHKENFILTKLNIGLKQAFALRGEAEGRGGDLSLRDVRLRDLPVSGRGGLHPAQGMSQPEVQGQQADRRHLAVLVIWQSGLALALGGRVE